MSSKNIKVMIDGVETDTTIRKIKKGEFKALIKKLAIKADEIIKLFDKKDILDGLPGVLDENIDFICDELILPLTKLTGEQLDEMDVVDVIQLMAELLEYNGIKIDKIINFLKPNPETIQKMGEIINFNGVPIPSLS